MKKIFKLIGIIALAAVIGFSITACGGAGDGVVNGGGGAGGGGAGGGGAGGGGAGGGGGGGSGGTFTLTDIPSQYNGKYADILGGNGNVNPQVPVYGYDWTAEPYTLARISNGRVNIPVWTISNNKFIKYSGNDTLTVCLITIYSNLDEDDDDNIEKQARFSSVTFSNGSVTKSWNDAAQIY
jgi:hypothetical protein